MKNLTPFFLVLVALFLAQPSSATRITYLPPLVSSVMIGGYDTTVSPPQYCQSGMFLKEILQGKPLVANTRTGGAAPGIVVTVRNISSYAQTVKIVIENIDFDACYWENEGVIFPPCFKRYAANGTTGFPVSFTLGPQKAATLRLQIGCQGDTAENYCWIAHFGVVSENTLITPASYGLYGIAALFNPRSSALVKYICYSLKSYVNMRVEVAEDKGALTGTVTTEGTTTAFGGRMTMVTGGSAIVINGGRPF